ncbi:putative haloacid dehalogenase-like hydrolase [Staphylococcus piscifermentans]|uniref:Phosphoglycolate phosphatase n=1 Tax=Staphylococcus piscifermentans TaxID=70258 RepID=A0A239UGC1_9STAP|nr:HAD family hydrolase [Staphylococcus piscifermentans]GEP85009.1 phosphoglycolate phosphatase [Staphylococcus piscifermentans]SNV08942.1 putative haloacid dehalogenase-like hydrolase [Staphylococcus piscifermentans]
MALKWILFDKDGTLIDFDMSWMKVGIQMVDEFVERYISPENAEHAYKTLGVDKDQDQVLPGTPMACGSLDEIIQNFNALAGEDVSEWTRQTSQYLIDHRVPEIKWIEGMTDALDTLKDAGYQIGILTSDTKKGTEQFIEATNTEAFFDFIISTETNAAEKPNPEVLRPLFDHAPDLKADEIAIIGDSPNDIQTAVNAGLGLSIGVLTGVGQEHELQHADYVVQSAPDAVEVLEKKNGRDA